MNVISLFFFSAGFKKDPGFSSQILLLIKYINASIHSGITGAQEQRQLGGVIKKSPETVANKVEDVALGRGTATRYTGSRIDQGCKQHIATG